MQQEENLSERSEGSELDYQEMLERRLEEQAEARYLDEVSEEEFESESEMSEDSIRTEDEEVVFSRATRLRLAYMPSDKVKSVLKRGFERILGCHFEPGTFPSTLSTVERNTDSIFFYKGKVYGSQGGYFGYGIWSQQKIGNGFVNQRSVVAIPESYFNHFGVLERGVYPGVQNTHERHTHKGGRLTEIERNFVDGWVPLLGFVFEGTEISNDYIPLSEIPATHRQISFKDGFENCGFECPIPPLPRWTSSDAKWIITRLLSRNQVFIKRADTDEIKCGLGSYYSFDILDSCPYSFRNDVTEVGIFECDELTLEAYPIYSSERYIQKGYVFLRNQWLKATFDVIRVTVCDKSKRIDLGLFVISGVADVGRKSLHFKVGNRHSDCFSDIFFTTNLILSRLDRVYGVITKSLRNQLIALDETPNYMLK